MSSGQGLEKKLSWWESEYLMNDVDYTILGSGIVGLSTAIELKQMAPSLKVLIIDKKTYPVGASTKNAGFACFGSVSEILDDIDNFGEKTCHKLIAMRWRGLELLKDRVQLPQMNYSNLPGLEIFDKNVGDYYHDQISDVNAHIEHVLTEKECFYSREGQFGREIVNRLEGCLNPQKMMAKLELIARNLGVIFLQGIIVEEIIKSDNQLMTNVGTIAYNKLIVCTNGFSRRILSDLDISPARNQVLVTNKIKGFSLKGCYHMDKGYVYFREVDSRLILGGGRHLSMETEATDILANTDEILDYLKNLAKYVILKGKDYKVEKIWSGILGIGENKVPIVKKINQDHCVAVRMGGMGVAIGSFIGRVAASILLDDDNSDLQLFVRD